MYNLILVSGKWKRIIPPRNEGCDDLQSPSNGIHCVSLQGYFLLFESMLDTVLFARDKWLKPNGCGKILLELTDSSVRYE